MFRRPVSRLPRHILPTIPLDLQTHTYIRLFTSTRSTPEANLLPFRNHCDKHDNIPRLGLNLQPIADLFPPTVKPPKPPSTAHTTTADPEILVALGALTTGCPETNNDCRPNTSKSRQNGIDDSFESNTASLLDGLATICVHKLEGQVLALAMQLDHVGRRIRLTIAGNNNVSEKVVRNLEAVWKILRDISVHQVERPRVCGGGSTNKRKKRGKKGKSTVAGKPPGSGDPALLRRLQHTIYQFTSKILLSRFNLHRLEFQKFATAFKKTAPKPDPTEEHRARKVLIGVMNVIEHTLIPLLHKLKPNGNLKESEWRTICIMMDGVLHDCEYILGNEGFCEKWVIMARSADKTISEGFSLRGYLEKITLLHSHIRALVRSAQSLRSTFVKELSIRPIPAERRTLLLPKTPEKLEALITSIAHQQGYAVVNTEFIRKIENYPSAESKVHCECLLVKHFHTLKNTPEPNPLWNNISPFSYIGVSKLSCQACGSWLKAYGSLGQQSFITKGIHPKWSRSWGMPQLVNKEEMKQVQEDMARDTARKFCLYQKKRARMVLLSDNTETPLIEDDNYPLDNEEAILYAAAKMERGQIGNERCAVPRPERTEEY